MKKLLFILFLVTVGVIFGSPYYTAYQLNQAYKNDDGATIANHIDYPNLQYNLNAQLMTRLDNTLEKNPIISKLVGSALKIGKPFIKTAVNGAVTKDNIETAISSKGQVNEATKKLAVAWVVVSEKIDFSDLVASLMTQQTDIETIIQNQIEKQLAEQELANSNKANADSEPEVSLNYCGFSCFKITGEVKGYPLTVKMEREGLLKWKITDIELP